MSSRPPTQAEVDLAKAKALFLVTVLKNKWLPHKPTDKQALFLSLVCREAFYGGAAGGGKSDALLMGALQFFDVPGYSALLLRRSFSDLALPGALMDRASQWLTGTAAHWSSDEKTWTNPASKSTITFGYLESDKDLYRYQSAEFQYIGFDELTQFPENFYTYMFSRLRRNVGVAVPLRMRAASNPGNQGHEWVKRRFILPASLKDGRRFVPARLTDNPHIDQKEYEESLSNLDAVLRAQLLAGNWDVKPKGSKFDKAWWKYVPIYSIRTAAKRVRYWDLAATEPKPGKDPDYTVGTRMSIVNGQAYIEDVVRLRGTPAMVEEQVKQTAALDYAFDPGHVIWMEQEPGSAGITTIDHYARYVLVQYDFRGIRSTGEKEVRANPLSASVQKGNCFLAHGDWNEEFIAELQLFPLGEHDDQVDSASGAYERLTALVDGEGVIDYYKDQYDEVERLKRLGMVPALVGTREGMSAYTDKYGGTGK